MSNYIGYHDITSPAVEPITLAQAKQYLVIDPTYTADDEYITGLIITARQYCEETMERAIYNRSMLVTLDFFPYPYFQESYPIQDRHSLYGLYWRQFAINLPIPMCVSVDSITYVDLNNVVQTVSPAIYTTDINSEPARIIPNMGMYWPYSEAYVPGSVHITYTAGSYGDGQTLDNCPMPIKQAMYMLISYWYNNRDSATSQPNHETDFSIHALLQPYTFSTFGLTD